MKPGIIEYVKQVKLEEAREEGVEKGRTEEKTQVVKRLLARAFAPKDIAIIAGVTAPFVEKIRKGAK